MTYANTRISEHKLLPARYVGEHWTDKFICMDEDDVKE